MSAHAASPSGRAIPTQVVPAHWQTRHPKPRKLFRYRGPVLKPMNDFCLVQDLEAGPIKSVHFSKVPKPQVEGDHSLEEDFFSAPDFVVGSRTGSIVAVRSGSFEETSSDVPSHRLLVQVGIAMPSMHSMAMCLLSG